MAKEIWHNRKALVTLDNGYRTDICAAFPQCFNNGNTDIKLIAKAFEDVFNIDLGDSYYKFLELKPHKMNRTKFLYSLCEALLKKNGRTGRKVTYCV